MAKRDSLSRVLHGQVYISDKNITQNLILAGTLSRECSCSRRRLGAAAGSADKPTVKISELVCTAPVLLYLLVSPAKA